MERLLYNPNNIFEELKSNEKLSKLSTHGYCRSWAQEALILIRDKFPKLKAEAREIEVEEEFCHTFLKVIVDERTSLILDGVGFGNKSPFFGYEDEAPVHLRNSRLDMINQLKI